MHFFMSALKNSKPKEQSLPEHQSEPQAHQQHEQIQQKVIKKIVVRKKPQMLTLNDQVIDTQGHMMVPEHKPIKSADVLTPSPRDKNQGPFISFMGSQEELEQLKQTKTPYLKAESPKGYNFHTALHTLQSSSSHQGRNLGRTKSRPIQPVSVETPSSKNMSSNHEYYRQNSIRTQFQSEGQQRQLNKYPTEISLEQEEGSSGCGREVVEKVVMGRRDRQMETSILEGKGWEVMNVLVGQNDGAMGKSSKFMFRPEFFRGNAGNSNQMNLVEQMQDNDSQSQVSRHNNKNSPSNNLTLSNKLTSALQSSHTVSNQTSSRSNFQQPTNPSYNINKSPGYKSYIDKQNRQLQEQKQRMNFYAQEANKLLCNVQTYDWNQTHVQVVVDRHYVPLKYMMEELVELFAIGEVIKYQLRYRSYEILTKIYAEASDYYNEKIQLEEPIKAYTFSLALKAILEEYEKSELDTVVTKIFQSSHVISYDDFLLQFNSVLNSKLVAILEPQSMKKQVDKTLEKIKNLFVIWIQTQYYNKKVKDILRSSKVVYDSIMTECSTVQEPHKFDIQLLEKFFLQGQRKNPMKKIKLDLYFRSLLGNDLLKTRWTDWINKDEMRLYNRYESKLMYERRQFGNKNDRTEIGSQMRTEKTIASTKKKFKINLEENYLSRRAGESRKAIESGKVSFLDR